MGGAMDAMKKWVARGLGASVAIAVLAGMLNNWGFIKTAVFLAVVAVGVVVLLWVTENWNG